MAKIGLPKGWKVRGKSGNFEKDIKRQPCHGDFCHLLVALTNICILDSDHSGIWKLIGHLRQIIP